ncbi:MAG: glutamate 5-kinase [Myxococcota bacterium]
MSETESNAWENVASAKRIVLKIGSSTLTRNGELRRERFATIARDVAAIRETGREVVLVSSGAIAVGAARLGWDHTGRSIRQKQAAAAVGQIGLVELYQSHFEPEGHHVGQVLLTRAGLDDRDRFLNARRTMLELLELGVIPIVNENDTIATEEIRFGDNDNLAATIVNAVEADLLVILTDVEGLYERPPVAGEAAPPLIQTVSEITPEIESIAAGPGTRIGSGGMITKLEAARNAANSGAATILCHGDLPDVLSDLMRGDRHGTLFSAGRKLKDRQHWMAFTAQVRGKILIDEGARRALQDRGSSLLPAGILSVEGQFQIGDAVACVNASGQEVARGLTSYSSGDIERLAGQPTKEIEPMLGYTHGDEIIHRDDLVLIGNED